MIVYYNTSAMAMEMRYSNYFYKQPDTRTQNCQNTIRPKNTTVPYCYIIVSLGPRAALLLTVRTGGVSRVLVTPNPRPREPNTP